jgi:hypothetical protein
MWRQLMMMWAVFAMTTPSQAVCKCLYSGGMVKEGETACITTAKGPRVARCGKSQNVTSWLMTEDRCEVKQSQTITSVQKKRG